MHSLKIISFIIGVALWGINASAQNISIVQPSPPCTAFGTTSGTCIQGSLIGTSGATIPLLNGTNIWSGVQTYGSGDVVVTAPAATATFTTDQSQTSGGSTLLPFVATTNVAVGQTVVGTSIPLGDQVASIVNNAQVSLTANGVSASGQKVLSMTATTGATAGQQCTDVTTPSAIGAGNVIASVQAGTSITMTTNLTGATANSDTITCDPVVTLLNPTTAAINSGAVITFNANHTTLSSASSFYDQGDASVNGNLNIGGITALGQSFTLSYFGSEATFKFLAGGAGTTTTWPFSPSANNNVALGTAFLQWSNVYSVLGTFSGTLTNSGIASTAQADVVCTTSAGVLSYQVYATGCVVSSERFKDMKASLTPAETIHLAASLLETKRWTYKNPEQFGDASEYVGYTAEQIAKIDPRFITYDEQGRPYAIKHQQLAEAALTGFSLMLNEIKEKDDQMRGCLADWKCRLFGWHN